MREHEERLKAIIEERSIDAEHLSFDLSCHSVAEAARTVGAEPEDFVKSICMVDRDGNAVVAIVKGEDRASTSRVAKALGIERPRVASPDEILEFTGSLWVEPPASASTPSSSSTLGCWRRRRPTWEVGPSAPW